ncbi:MAG: histidine kinase [Steroidobacteraceae bacterium]
MPRLQNRGTNQRFPLGHPWWALCFSLSGFTALIDPLRRHASAVELALTVAGVLIYIGTFLLLLTAWRRGRSGLWPTLGIVLIGVLFAPFNSFAWLFFVVATAISTVVAGGDVRTAASIVGGIVAVILIEKLLLGLQWSFVGVVAGVGIPTAVMCTLTLRRSIAVREVARHAERERIARDMHDVLGHTLSVIILKADLAARLVHKDPDRATTELSELDRIARDTLDEVRETLRGYRRRGLQEEFEIARHSLAAAGVTVAARFEPAALDPDRENALSLSLREGVTNILRHARATHCALSVSTIDECCVLEIEDNGTDALARTGARPDEHEKPNGDSPGAGLNGMRERIEAFGGTLTQRVEHGVHLTIKVPLIHTGNAGQSRTAP